MTILPINRLHEYIPKISPVQCSFYAEGCMVALENQGHQTGVLLIVDGDFQDKFGLEWETPDLKAGWQEPVDLAHFGGIALAFFLILNLTEYTIIRQGKIGGGFDYYLGFKEDSDNYDPDNFLNARLEISGLNRGNLKELVQRIKGKLQQVSVSDSWNLPAYIVVTEFGKPISYIKKK